MKLKALLLIVIISGLLFSGCGGSAKMGLLQGKVSIGPIYPVEQPGQTTTIRCDVYDSRKIIIYDKSGTKLLKQVDIECNVEENYARYRVELEPGIYTVDINHIGIDHCKSLPKQVEIRSGITIRLDVDIDTGIR